MSKNEINQITLLLENVESEHCALIVDKALSKMSFLTSHKVELNNGWAKIQLEDQSKLILVIQQIRELGYGVVTVKQSFPVLGMSCASCASGLESGLENLNGIIGHSVNYANESLQIEFLPNMFSIEELQQKVREIGYDIIIEKESVDEQLSQIATEKYDSLRKRTIWSGILSIPIVIIGMFMMDLPYGNEIMWILSTPIVFYFGKDFFINAWKQLKHRSANMDTLVALSTGIAYFFSVFNVIFASQMREKGLHPHVYFEAASVIIVFILLGKLLEEKAKGNTSKALRKLMNLQVKNVTVLLENGTEKSIPIEELLVGDLILVKPGEKIAVDGKVISGKSYIDESMLSGESIPVLKEKDTSVFAGTINQKGSFTMQAVKIGKDTLLSSIIQSVQDAQGSKAPVQKLVDKIARVFVPTVLVIAILTFTLWMVFGADNRFEQGIISAVTVLVIACPCALGLATPTAIMVGVGKGAEQGILIKDAESLEIAKKITTVILDKTGTITEGKPVVNAIQWEEKEALYEQVLLSIEKQSEHPLAQAVVTYFKGVESVELTQFESITGKGVFAVHNAETYLVGNRLLLKENKIEIPKQIEAQAKEWECNANTVIWYATGNKLIAIFAISDRIKENSRKAILQLQKMEIDVIMLTGDNQLTARAVAQQTGIEHYQAELLPQHKADYVRKLQEEGKIVAMVGDGINDSTALATADVSIAMGAGSDIAMDVAKMTLISSDLTKIPQAITLSKQTVATIKQNLFWAFIYNIIGIPLAAGLLYPINGFLLDPMLAGAAMALSSVSVVSNSLRLKWKK